MNLGNENQTNPELVNTYTGNTSSNPGNLSNPSNTILIEKHYVPYNLYCEMFNSINICKFQSIFFNS